MANIQPDPRENRIRYPGQVCYKPPRKGRRKAKGATPAAETRAQSAARPVLVGETAVLIYTDGACSPNPGPGAWAALLRYASPTTGDITEREVTGYQHATTNNRMEMMGAIGALEALTRPSRVTLYTDSRLLQLGAMRLQKRRKNLDLWARLDLAAKPHAVIWEWVKGHNGHPDNERADRLATGALAHGRGST